jgi:hypothetical protein
LTVLRSLIAYMLRVIGDCDPHRSRILLIDDHAL